MKSEKEKLMVTSIKHTNETRRSHPLCAVILAAVGAGCALGPSAASAQNTTGSTTMTAPNVRSLADILSRVQQMFLTPITFEEVPYQSAAELRSITVLRNGSPQVNVVNPVTDFNVTLGQTDSSSYLAAQSVLSAYKGAGRPGVYAVIQSNNRVDVIPTQVLGANGSMQSVTPVMSQPVTFPPATRSIADTLQLLVDDVSRASGFKVLLLNAPGLPLETVELGAAGQPARDVVATLATALKRPLSFQCLYDAGSQTYYLNVIAVAPDPVPGGPAQRGRIKPVPTVGPADSPFFIKK
jgi:hypothetical protein